MMASEADTVTALTQVQAWFGVALEVLTVVATLFTLRGDVSGLRDYVNDRFDKIDERLESLELRRDGLETEMVRMQNQFDAFGRMTIRAHGNGQVTSEELRQIWAETQ